MAASPLFSSFVAVVPGTGLLFGLLLLAAIVGGYAARMVHMPRVVGYLLGGVALQFILRGAIARAQPDAGLETLEAAAIPLKAIQDLALGLILFTIGSVFERKRMWATGPRVLRIGLLEMSMVTSLVFGGCLLVSWLTNPTHSLIELVVLSALLATAGIATAPAATLFVLQEYDAKGPITDTILGVTGFNNLVCIVSFYVCFLLFAAFGAVETSGNIGQHPWIAMGLATIGSVLLGLVFGTLISMFHARLPLGESLLIFFALFIILGAGEEWLLKNGGMSYNFLLTALVTGGIFFNVAVNSQKLVTSLQTVGGPIFAGFFVIAGYKLHIQDLAHMGWLGGAYIAMRAAGKTIGGHLGVRWARAPRRTDGKLGTTLLCQAAVVIGLASFVSTCWHHELADQFNAVILGSVVVFELIGPFLVKRRVVQGGEVKAITLLARGGAATEGPDTARLTFQSLLRLFGRTANAQTANAADMQVKHIMRTNVQFIHAADTLDDVLHFIERSTYSHFTVVDDDSIFVGVIHFSDVRDVIYDPATRGLVTAVDLVDSAPIVVPMDMPLDQLLKVFTERNVGVLPVVESADDRHIVGVVEQRDLLRALHLSQLSP